MSRIYMGENLLQQVTILKSLVIIAILIVKEKNAAAKTRILQLCTTTEKLSWLDKH